MTLKSVLPLSLRDRLRPTYQQLQRSWHESGWSPKPADWPACRQRLLGLDDFRDHYEAATSEFGITQIYDEIQALVAQVRAAQPRTVVEVGTHKGGNSFLFCHALPTPDLIVGLDLNVQNAAKLKYCVRPGQRYVALHGDSQVVEQRRRLERVLGGRPVDFLFIDGDHSYAGVRADFELYAPLVRPGGIIGLHDIIEDHGSRFGIETNCWTGGVHRFWAELRERYDATLEYVDDPEQDGFGIGVVLVPEAGR